MQRVFVCCRLGPLLHALSDSAALCSCRCTQPAKYRVFEKQWDVESKLLQYYHHQQPISTKLTTKGKEKLWVKKGFFSTQFEVTQLFLLTRERSEPRIWAGLRSVIWYPGQSAAAALRKWTHPAWH